MNMHQMTTNYNLIIIVVNSRVYPTECTLPRTKEHASFGYISSKNKKNISYGYLQAMGVDNWVQTNIDMKRDM